MDEKNPWIRRLESRYKFNEFLSKWARIACILFFTSENNEKRNEKGDGWQLSNRQDVKGWDASDWDEVEDDLNMK